MFGGSARAETETRRGVEDQPDVELVVGNHVSDVGVMGPGCHRPVDITGIVARHVGAGFAPLGPVAREEPGMIAGEEAIQPAKHREPQPLDRDLRRRGETRCARDRLDPFGRPGSSELHQTASGARFPANWEDETRGETTVVSTSINTSSTVTPSATASKDSTSRWLSTS